jgi:heme exporter protein A
MHRRAGEALMKLVAEGLSSTRGGRRLFNNLSFSVAPGEALLLLGPNGAGKTTLIRAIAGLVSLENGRVRLEGASADDWPSQACHYVGHLNALKPGLTVEENAVFWARFLGGMSEQVGAALATFGLDRLRDVPAGYLSAGQKRRLALVRPLLAERPLWLLDEPGMSLDAAAQDTLAQCVNAHLAGGGLVVAATHAALGFKGSRELNLGAAV